MSSDNGNVGNGFRTPDRKITPQDMENMTVTQLRIKLKSLKLPIYGCKRTLCQRLLMSSSDAASQSQFSHSNFPVFENSGPKNSNSRNHSVDCSNQKCKLTDLRERCKIAGLPTSGRKQELIDRLEVYYEKALLNDILDPKVLNMEDAGYESIRISTSFGSTSSFMEVGSSHPLIDPYSLTEMSDFFKFTKEQLKALCRALRLKVSGKKEEIVKRIFGYVSVSKNSLCLPQNDSHDSTNVVQKRDFDTTGMLLADSRKKRFRSCHSAQQNLSIRSRSTEERRVSPVPIQKNPDIFKRPLRLKYYIFSNSFVGDEFVCSILCEDENPASPHKVVIGLRITCTCGGCKRHHLCQHVLFIFLRILNFSVDDTILIKSTLSQEQLIFVLRGIKHVFRAVLSSKPALKKRFFTRATLSSGEEPGSVEVIREETNGKACGICFQSLESFNSMFWCRAQCGKNMHISCYDKWLQYQETKENRCPYCAAPWERIPKNTRFQSNLKRNRIE